MNDRVLLQDRAPLTFAGSPLDRGDALRRDPGKIAEVQDSPDARFILLKEETVCLQDSGGLLWADRSTALALESVGETVFLGHWGAYPCFASNLAESAEAPGASSFVELRRAAMGMPHSETGALAQARALIAWHARHRFCSNCGAPTAVTSGGARRHCDACGTEHFPRVDPVAIMLIEHDGACLLGRQTSWPEGMWSALAGFVEPGETLEEACAREIYEEAGVEVDPASVRYVMGQPWPFPSTLMVGLIATARSREIVIDTHELEAARWVTREEVQAALAGQHPEIRVPPNFAIAGRLAELWVSRSI